MIKTLTSTFFLFPSYTIFNIYFLSLPLFYNFLKPANVMGNGGDAYAWRLDIPV
jgi:hypothetical protein